MSSQSNRPIFLLGFMCSGKTTLGNALGKITGMPFIDLDEAIEEKAGMKIKEIFANMGEGAFRQIEQQALAQASRLGSVIVGCGGGTPCREGAMELMNAAGITVHLVPDKTRLVRRLMLGKENRPLLAGIDTEADMHAFAEKMLDARMPYYSKAAFTFDSSFLENDEEIAATVKRFIKEILKD